MTPELKAELTAAFEFFGPDVIERGMRVFWREAGPTGCSRCFVGYMAAAAAEPSGEELERGYFRIREAGWDLNDTDSPSYALSITYENHPEYLHRLATEWLEAQRVVRPEPLFV